MFYPFKQAYLGRDLEVLASVMRRGKVVVNFDDDSVTLKVRPLTLDRLSKEHSELSYAMTRASLLALVDIGYVRREKGNRNDSLGNRGCFPYVYVVTKEGYTFLRKNKVNIVKLK